MKIKPEIRKIYNARVFFDSTNAGNSAVCFMLDDEPEQESIAQYCKGRKQTCCFLWKSNDAIQVRCFNGERKINFCGHGLLAGAYAWSRFAENSDIDAESLQTDAHTYKICKKNTALWLSVPRIR